MNEPENNALPNTSKEIELSQDKELWDLLEKGSPHQASPLFSRNIMREIRLEESETTEEQSFWRTFFRPQVLLAGGLAALTLTAVLLWNPASQPGNPSPLAEQTDPDAISLELASSLESSLESELLLAAADTPELFSDEEVIAMLF